jgi:hypothetical protein
MLFCLPIGAVAVSFSRQASRQLAAGNADAALKSSQSAKRWGCAAIIIGLLGRCFGLIGFLAYMEEQGAFR